MSDESPRKPVVDFLNFYNQECRETVNLAVEAFSEALAERRTKLVWMPPTKHETTQKLADGWTVKQRVFEAEEHPKQYLADATQSIEESVAMLKALQLSVLGLSRAVPDNLIIPSSAWLTQELAAETTPQDRSMLAGLQNAAYNMLRTSLLTSDGKIDPEENPPVEYSAELKAKLAAVHEKISKMAGKVKNSPECKNFLPVIRSADTPGRIKVGGSAQRGLR